ncbi:MAG: 4-alpha-glucanotransferase [Treponema sp.]|nr:4-alpha-glucanotransferase [Treponema sp.]
MIKKTGIAVPLAALYTKESESCGDFSSLIPFADFCSECGFSVIQLLPVNDTGTHSSPYSGLSAFALHPLYIRISALPEFEEALLNDKSFAAAYKKFQKDFKYTPRFDYEKLSAAKISLLHLLYAYIEKRVSGKIKKSAVKKPEGSKEKKKLSIEEAAAPQKNFADTFELDLGHFARRNPWVTEYAVFKNLKDIAMQASWKSWDKTFSSMTKEQIKLRWNNKALKSSHNFFVWCQLRAHEQFKEAADYIKEKGIVLKGDIPILMNEDSVDCWAHGEYFNQELRAGSPPDGENPAGQNWGFPTYRWDAIEADEFSWWKNRIKLASEYYSAFRIDHILGFFRIWAASQNEDSAYLGHTVPFASFTNIDLIKAGFDEGRIHWLSEPHIPTRIIEDITWNHDEAVSALEKICDRLGTEELWNFKKKITSSSDITSVKFFDDETKDSAVKNAFIKKWKDRALILMEESAFKKSAFKKGELDSIEETLLPKKIQKFVKVYSYSESTAWKTLTEEEKDKLKKIFDDISEKENELWKQQAEKVLSPITTASEMIPCAEDLGVTLPCMEEVLEEFNILSLKVVRWCRDWFTEKQPYVPLKKYPERSVATTSVHDSSTLRQWWNTEKQSAEQFLELFSPEKITALSKAIIEAEKAPAKKSDSAQPELPQEEKELTQEEAKAFILQKNFSAEIAAAVLKKCAETESAWFINPLQDYLFLDGSYYLENADDERINIPGSVSAFNWTYRIPQNLETLLKNKPLIQKIKETASLHDTGESVE